jgi:hypothetical protein
MRAEVILQRHFAADLEDVHLARVRVVFAAVRTLLKFGRLSLTSLGRSIAENTSPKHGIKRIDRLVGNARLHAERLAFYRGIARRIITPGSQPVILVDWTAVTPKLWALAAAVSFEGRALMIYAETHPISRYLKPHVNAEFLHQLERVLPRGCAPIIVADAGFRSPFMKLVLGMGWNYVARLRRPAKVRKINGGGDWMGIQSLFAEARYTPRDLGDVEVGWRLRHVCRLVAVRQRIRHRNHRASNARHTIVERERRAAREPWLLITSLKISAKRVVALYARRMQIEETFRDAKNPRFGFALSYSRTRIEKRADVLLLVASLAHLVAVVVGLTAEAADLHLRFQANTIKNRRVLSVAMLGRFVMAKPDLEPTVEMALSRTGWAEFGICAARALVY